MATTFSNTLQQAAAQIARAPQATRLQLATEFYNTVNKLPRFRDAAEATSLVNDGIITNRSLYCDESLGGLISVATGSRRKVIIKDPIKTL
jgi:hypothetical protein